MEMRKGNVVEFSYGAEGKPVISHAFVDGKLLGPREFVGYVALKQTERTTQLLRQNGGHSRNMLVAGQKSAPISGQAMIGGGDCTYTTDGACGLDDDFWDSCAASIVCLGFMDDINSFVSNLSGWLQVGAGLGSTIFGTLSVLAGDAAAIVLAEIGLGAALGGAVVIAFAGGYIVGTGIYYVGTWVYNNSGQLVYSGR